MRLKPVRRPAWVRSLFMSDVHLGSCGCQAEYLLQFLSSIEARNIRVIGDMPALEEMRRKFAEVICNGHRHGDGLAASGAARWSKDASETAATAARRFMA
jgi:UDP-2,3-diacylglucosamine pyrophosphatase LpxH